MAKEAVMKVAGIFSENMILLRDKEVCVFGTGENREKIQVVIDKIEAVTEVCDGRWLVTLPPHSAGGPFVMKISGKDCVIEIANVMYGEVWFAGGQSNMELELQNADYGKEELAQADYPDIRYYNVIKTPFIDDEVLKKEAAQSWHMCKNGDFRDMSAVAYFFAKKTYEQLQVPVGIIDCYQGGTSISCWLSEENLRGMPEGRPYIDEYEKVTAGQTEEEYDLALEEYNQRLDSYNQRVEELKKKNPGITMEELNDRAGLYPWPPPMGRKSLYRPCGLYDTMICRVAPYTVRGFLYYQGEEDALKTTHYDRLLEKLIAQFRSDWRDSALPFEIIQLPMFIAKNEPEDYSWPGIRLAQEQVHQLVPYTGLTVLLDLGEYDNIHPTDKKTPGTRLALQVLEKVYREPVEGSAMFFRFAEPAKNKLSLSFANTYGKIQLLENGLKDIREAETEGMPTGFELSQNGTDWYPASAVIRGEQIIVWSERTPRPAFVRYGYFNYGKVNVYNRAALPLAPFCEQL